MQLEGHAASLVHILDTRVRAEISDITSLPAAHILRITHTPCAFLFGPPDVVKEEAADVGGVGCRQAGARLLNRDTYNRRRNGMHHCGSLDPAVTATAAPPMQPAQQGVAGFQNAGQGEGGGVTEEQQPPGHPFKFR